MLIGDFSSIPDQDMSDEPAAFDKQSGGPQMP
jgi:hypothetical protein